MAEGIILRELFLIRHGESRGNAGIEGEGLADSADPCLTELGVSQAEKLGVYLRDKIEFDAVYSSGLRRAVETARGVIENQTRELPLNVFPDICEIGVPPDYQGMSIDGLKELCPGAVISDGYKDCESLVVPDETPGENEERYFNRAKTVLDYFEARYTKGEKIAVVSHAAFLTYLLFYIMGYRDREPSYDFTLANTGLTRIIFYEPGSYPYGDIAFECVNDLRHLV